MKENITHLFKNLKQYLFIFLGFVYIFIYIYFNFIRERLPKDIPFTLTEFRFYSLIIICIMYCYLIYRSFYPKMPSKIIIYILSLILKPLIYFISFLKEKKFIYQKFYDIWIDMVAVIDNWSFLNNVFFIYVSAILPRIMLLIIFIIDIFYLKKLEVFYYFIFLSIFPLLYSLFIKYMETILEEYIQVLEALYTQVCVFEKGIDHLDYKQNPKVVYHDKDVSIRKYIEIQYEEFIKSSKEEDIEYYGSPLSTNIRYEEHEKKYKKDLKKMTMQEIEILHEEFNFIMPRLLIIKIFLDYQTKNAMKSFYIYNIKILILILYLICWLYILIISFPTLEGIPFVLQILEDLIKYSNIPEPFSHIKLWKICT